MASTYEKNNKIYITWYDPFKGKNINKSTGLEYNSKNLKAAKKIAKDLQAEISQQNDNLKSIGIKKDSIGNAFEHFLKNNSNKNKNTIYEYNWFFNHFTKTFPKETICTAITKLKCEDWIINLWKLNNQQNTLRNYVKVLKKFLSFLAEYNYLPLFKLNKDVLIQSEVKEIIVFSENDVIEIMKGLKEKNSNFSTTIKLLVYTGLRPSDLLSLSVKDIDLKNQGFHYYSPKSKEYFHIPIHEDLVPILQARIDEIEDGKIVDYKDSRAIGKAFRRYLDDLEMSDRQYNLRTFRKSFVSFAHSSGMELATVSELIGHKKITTTQKFYKKLNLSTQSDELKKLKFPSFTS